MARTTSPRGRQSDLSAGDLSAHVDGVHPAEVPFLFEWQPKRFGWSLVTSFATNVSFILLLVLVNRFAPRSQGVTAFMPEASDRLVWLSGPGPGGGGGGGGNQIKEPPRQAEIPGKDEITVPVVEPLKVEPQQRPKVEPNPVQQVNIPVQTLAAATDSLPGVIEAPLGPPSLSQGSGSLGGAGTGKGSGIGSGAASGLGVGFGGGTGGGAYRPGNGVTVPRLLHEVKPSYTSDAMRAKIQGTVLLECIVRQDGLVSDVRVVRSLDQIFGLDQEAINATRQWRFAPGTRFGDPVPVLVTVELTFTLR